MRTEAEPGGRRPQGSGAAERGLGGTHPHSLGGADPAGALTSGLCAELGENMFLLMETNTESRDQRGQPAASLVMGGEAPRPSPPFPTALPRRSKSPAGAESHR